MTTAQTVFAYPCLLKSAVVYEHHEAIGDPCPYGSNGLQRLREPLMH